MIFPTRNARDLFTAVVVSIGFLSCTSASGADIWSNIDTSQFTSLSENTPVAVNFLGNADVTMSRISAVGNLIQVATWDRTFTTPVGGQANPDWVLGARSYFELSISGAGTAQSTVSYEFQFAGGLATNSQLVMIDFDASEQVKIMAYDSLDNLITFGDTTILLSPGSDSTPFYDGFSWAAAAGATGLLRDTSNNSESNIIASISSSTSIYRVVYDFDFSQVVDPTGATIRFQVAAVPEPSTFATAIAGAACCVLSTRWRRKKA